MAFLGGQHGQHLVQYGGSWFGQGQTNLQLQAGLLHVHVYRPNTSNSDSV